LKNSSKSATSPRSLNLDDTKTVRQIVEEGVQHIVDLLKENEDIGEKLGVVTDDDEMMKLIDRQGEVLEQIEHLGGWELDYRLGVFMDALRCPEDDRPSKSAPVANAAVSHWPGCCSAARHSLLDEPTNHLDAESVQWLEQYLQSFPGTVIAVTHDRYFLDNVAGWILELDRGEGIPWQGNYSTWLEQKTKRLAQEEKSGRQTPQTTRTRTGVGAHGRQRPTSQRQGPFECL
jgi:sulfate-transporting ATPase